MHAAADAGFTGIGLRLHDLRRAEQDDAAVRDLLDSRDLGVFELEYTWRWTAR